MKKIVPLLKTDLLIQKPSTRKIESDECASPISSCFDPDLLPTGTFHGDFQIMTLKDLKKGYFTPKIKSYQTKQRYFKSLLEVASDTPEFVLSLFDNDEIQNIEMNHFREEALRKLVKKAKDSNSLEHYQHLLDQHLSITKANSKINRHNLDVLSYKIFKIAFQDKDIRNHDFNLWGDLELCRKGCKKSFLPILRLSLIFNKLKKRDIEKAVELAAKINPIKTYNYFLMISTIDFEEGMPNKYRARLLDVHNRFKNKELLPSLKKNFPFDWKLAQFTEADIEPSETSTLKSVMYLRKYKKHLIKGINFLINDDFKNARTELVRAKPYGIGESTSYAYICLSWLLEGDASKGVELLLKETDCFLLNRDPKELFSEYISFMYKSVFFNVNHPPVTTKDRVQNQLLRELLKTVNSQRTTVNSFATIVPLLNQCNESLQINSNVLPMVFQILKWIKRNSTFTFDMFENSDKRTKAFEALNILLAGSRSCLSNLVDIDERVKDIFTHQDDDLTHTYISGFQISLMPLNNLKSGEVAPEVSFSDDFYGDILTDSSRHEFAVETALIAHDFLTSLLCLASDFSSFFEDKKIASTVFPENAQFGAFLVIKGIQGGINYKNRQNDLYQIGLQYLNTYLSIDTEISDYRINEETSSWAIFSVTSLSPESIVKNRELPRLEKKIKSNYFKSIQDMQSKTHKNIGPYLTGIDAKKSMVVPSRNSIFHAREAISALTKREEKGAIVCIPGDGSPYYKVFEEGEKLFAWKKGESFENWGIRLTEAVLPEFQYDKPVEYSNLESPEEGIEMPSKCSETLSVLKEIQLFWKTFNSETQFKNEFIQNGGSEDNESTDLVPLKWCQDNKSKWSAIIDDNTPEEYPNFKKLSDKLKKGIKEIIQDKRHHACEVIVLKQLWENIISKLPKEDILLTCVSLLIENTHAEKKNYFVSLYVGSKELAEEIYKTLLEYSSKSVISYGIFNRGPDHWNVKSAEESTKNLLSDLEKLTGCFHGPEVHLNGKGPTQPHYNAGVYNGGANPINTHIYYPE
ncbi:hypothetical protein HOG98_08465 [bacterium]|jgi:hypothetical protein|nr:hypothetical protein [bacterium]